MKLDRIIAVRNNKTVYRDGDLCLKVFNDDFSKADILNAAGSAGASSSVSNTINVVDNVSKNSFDNISTMSKMQSSIDNLANKISELDTSNAGTFVQNNYSPKALSTATIYRQTKNQISLARNKPNSGFTR